jgi:hypothetical protein
MVSTLNVQIGIGWSVWNYAVTGIAPERIYRHAAKKRGEHLIRIVAGLSNRITAPKDQGASEEESQSVVELFHTVAPVTAPIIPPIL